MCKNRDMPRNLTPRPRSQPRRDALLDAAVEVVGKHGLAGTTHRSVTEAAGVPLATAQRSRPASGLALPAASRAP